MSKFSSDTEEKNINKLDLLKKVREIVKEPGKKKEEENRPIIFDGKQYAVRIPKKFADAMKLDGGHHAVKFELYLPDTENKKPRLIAEVVEDGKD